MSTQSAKKGGFVPTAEKFFSRLMTLKGAVESETDFFKRLFITPTEAREWRENVASVTIDRVYAVAKIAGVDPLWLSFGYDPIEPREFSGYGCAEPVTV